MKTQEADVVITRDEKGMVKWFSKQKGFGFITRDTGGDVFVHHTGITGAGFKNLIEGQGVTFDVVDAEKGPKAVNVSVVEG